MEGENKMSGFRLRLNYGETSWVDEFLFAYPYLQFSICPWLNSRAVLRTLYGEPQVPKAQGRRGVLFTMKEVEGYEGGF